MCSVQDDDLPLKPPERDRRMGRVCMKCKEEQAILVTRVNDAFCKACFQVYVTHKFRAAIGKTKLVRDGELVLVAYSGGPSSSALLSLIQEGLSQRAHKKLRFKPGLLFIDEGAVVGLSPAERLAICERIQSVMKNSGFPCYIKALEEAFDLDTLPVREETAAGKAPSVPAEGSVSPDCDTSSIYSSGTASVTLPEMSTVTSPAFRNTTDTAESSRLESTRLDGGQSNYQVYHELEQRLKQTLDGMKSISAKEDFIRSLRHKILLEVAKHCGYSKVMLGCSGTQLAVRLLTDISTGRGAHAAMETAFSDRRNDDIMFLRPMRDFSSKEVAVYNSIHSVETVFTPTLTTKAETNVSIEHLTESFVTGLQADYPSTVSNIMRTGEKLDPSKDAKMDKHCAMCRAPLDTSVGASSALSAVEFSQKISRGQKGQTQGDSCTQPAECCGEGDGSCQSTVKHRPSPEEVIANLCYACRLIVRSMDDVYKLPQYVLKDVAWRNRRSKMMAEIGDFLLQDT